MSSVTRTGVSSWFPMLVGHSLKHRCRLTAPPLKKKKKKSYNQDLLLSLPITLSSLLYRYAPAFLSLSPLSLSKRLLYNRYRYKQHQLFLSTVVDVDANLHSFSPSVIVTMSILTKPASTPPLHTSTAIHFLLFVITT